MRYAEVAANVQALIKDLPPQPEFVYEFLLAYGTPNASIARLKSGQMNLAKAEGTDWGYYIRKQSSTVRAKGTDEQELIGLTATLPFDDRFNQQASVDDLSPRLIEEFLKEVGSELADDVVTQPLETIGRQMNIVSGPSEMVFPKDVGLLFFNDKPERFSPPRKSMWSGFLMVRAVINLRKKNSRGRWVA